MGPKIMNCRKPEQVGTKEYGKMFKKDPGPGGWQGSGQGGEKLEDRRTKKKNHKERISEAFK